MSSNLDSTQRGAARQSSVDALSRTGTMKQAADNNNKAPRARTLFAHHSPTSLLLRVFHTRFSSSYSWFTARPTSAIMSSAHLSMSEACSTHDTHRSVSTNGRRHALANDRPFRPPEQDIHIHGDDNPSARGRSGRAGRPHSPIEMTKSDPKLTRVFPEWVGGTRGHLMEPPHTSSRRFYAAVTDGRTAAASNRRARCSYHDRCGMGVDARASEDYAEIGASA
ncbi:hypothetical protein BST61_g10246 [Cercospora zeina]